MSTHLDSWILRLIAVVDEYEEQHSADHLCLAGPLFEVDPDVIAEARGYLRGWREGLLMVRKEPNAS